MAWDAATQQFILFDSFAGTTWNWNGSAWTQLSPATSPPSRDNAGLAYDAASQQLILFGGNGSTLNDTWEWNGTTWTQLVDPGCTNACASSPHGRSATRMAYDPTLHEIIMFGGGAGFGPTDNWNDTWAWNGTAWSQLVDPGCTNSCASSPPGRNLNTLAFDSTSNQLVLFGGENVQGTALGFNDTWTFNGTAWAQVVDPGCTNACASSPSDRVGSVMADDPAAGGLVLFGGMNDFSTPEYNDTWLWNGSSWSQIDDGGSAGCGDFTSSAPPVDNSCPGSPTNRDIGAFAYDPGASQLVLFGGQIESALANGSGDDTWTIPAVLSHGAPTSIVSLDTSQNPATAGQSITFTASVAGQNPTGSVTFYVDNLQTRSSLSSSGQSTFATSSLSAGDHTVVVIYSGDATYGNGSASLTETINPAIAIAAATPPPTSTTTTITKPAPIQLTLDSTTGQRTKSSVILSINCVSGPCVATGALSVARKTAKKGIFEHLVVGTGTFSITAGQHVSETFNLTGFGKSLLSKLSGTTRFAMTLDLQVSGQGRVIERVSVK